MGHKELFNFFGAIILLCLTIFLAVYLPIEVAYGLLILIVGLIIAIGIVNARFAKKLTLKYDFKNISNLKDELEGKYPVNDETYDSAFKRQFEIRNRANAVLLALFLLMVVVFGLVIKIAIVHGPLFFIALLIPLYFIIALGVDTISTPMVSYGFLLRKRKYKVLYQILAEIKQDLKINKRIVLYVNNSSNAVVYYNYGFYHISLGIFLLMSLNKDELRSILYHEAGHIINQDTKRLRARVRLQDKLDRLLTKKIYRPVSLLCSALSMYYLIELIVINIVLSKSEEKRADLVVKDAKLNKEFISAGIKLRYWDAFSNALQFQFQIPKDDKPSESFYQNGLDEFMDVVSKSRERFNHYIKVEMELERASHPTLRSRMEAMGIDSFEYMPIEAYDKDEIEVLLKTVNKFVTANVRYYNHQHEGYLNEIAAINEYEKNMEIDEIKMLDYVYSNFSVGNLEKAYETVKNILVHFPNNLRARNVLGQLKLSLYDDVSGIEDIYVTGSARVNLSDTLSFADQYSIWLGLKEEHERFKELFIKQTGQFGPLNYNEIDRITTKTKLTAATIDSKLQEKIITLIKDANFNRLYIVNRELAGRNFILVFVGYDVKSTMINETMDSLFKILNVEQEEYVLRVLRPKTQRILSSVTKPLYVRANSKE